MAEKPTAEQTDKVMEKVNQLAALIKELEEMNALPEIRSRELSLAITNAEQALHWLRDAYMVVQGRELWLDGN